MFRSLKNAHIRGESLSINGRMVCFNAEAYMTYKINDLNKMPNRPRNIVDLCKMETCDSYIMVKWHSKFI